MTHKSESRTTQRMGSRSGGPQALARAAACGMALCAAAWGADWPQWRGPARDGVSAETGWLSAWPKDGPKVLWRAKVGEGYSAVSVVGDRAYTMGNVEGLVQARDVVWCLDAGSGATVWQCELPGKPGNYPGPRATPTVDGANVYALTRHGDLVCLDAADGKVRWKKQVREEFGVGAEPNFWGLACSPLAMGDKLVLDLGKVLVLNQADGSLDFALGDQRPGFSSPVLFEFAGKRHVTSFNGFGLCVYDLAERKEVGKQAWPAKWAANAATPVVADGRLFVTSGYDRGCGLFRLAPDGLQVVYTNVAVSSECVSPVLYRDHLYAVSGEAGRQGKLVCVEFATGKVAWTHDGFRVGGGLLLADGKLLHIEDSGQLAVIAAQPDGYRELARATVMDGKSWTMPVLANGRIYCRSSKGALVCLDVRAP